jgi:hypothetical protein
MPVSADVSAWLRAETPHNLRLLERLRDRLVRKLDRADKLEAVPGGEVRDPVPDRDWCRALRTYQAGYQGLLVEERERAKLALAARLKGGATILTDEEYDTGVAEIQRHALKELPVEDLVAELAKRGLKLPARALVEDAEDREDE